MSGHGKSRYEDGLPPHADVGAQDGHVGADVHLEVGDAVGVVVVRSRLVRLDARRRSDGDQPVEIALLHEDGTGCAPSLVDHDGGVGILHGRGVNHRATRVVKVKEKKLGRKKKSDE
jgi:hypothetical protein